MLEYLNNIDTQLFLVINGWHSPLWDKVMVAITHSSTWIPLYLIIVASLIYKFRLNGLKLVVIILLLIGFADQASSRLAKPGFARLRPSHNEYLSEKIHIIDNYRGGTYGYFSSHASNTFALCTFLCLLFYRKNKWIAVLIPWAILVSYSRIYVGVHYPGDILTGAIFGSLSAILCFRLLKVRLAEMVRV